ncbi:PQQ-binding-like beta-propeller repeat protein [Natranaerobius thermophilus]|uniref:Pyrrolo-quinoline quinone repeat domain-containing protein n=1 Tax=Natranaerobius thermophilus (strain ATCC BAA-1301 / DSM 18059 / JW/NM-WN-LF) TaxID=457570 RepID=B2A7D9_NATTJ|nr:PQQ-binding-like beta-propeller repeat protein [Natranaerobius thermophilus]ACB84331.1 hypothetical protein Nther_0741 [Natranaerobius thermophilus JW/NM-WN-LF]
MEVTIDRLKGIILLSLLVIHITIFTGCTTADDDYADIVKEFFQGVMEQEEDVIQDLSAEELEDVEFNLWNVYQEEQLRDILRDKVEISVHNQESTDSKVKFDVSLYLPNFQELNQEFLTASKDLAIEGDLTEEKTQDLLNEEMAEILDEVSYKVVEAGQIVLVPQESTKKNENYGNEKNVETDSGEQWLVKEADFLEKDIPDTFAKGKSVNSFVNNIQTQLDLLYIPEELEDDIHDLMNIEIKSQGENGPDQIIFTHPDFEELHKQLETEVMARIPEVTRMDNEDLLSGVKNNYSDIIQREELEIHEYEIELPVEEDAQVYQEFVAEDAVRKAINTARFSLHELQGEDLIKHQRTGSDFGYRGQNHEMKDGHYLYSEDEKNLYITVEEGETYSIEDGELTDGIVWNNKIIISGSQGTYLYEKENDSLVKTEKLLDEQVELKKLEQQQDYFIAYTKNEHLDFLRDNTLEIEGQDNLWVFHKENDKLTVKESFGDGLTFADVEEISEDQLLISTFEEGILLLDLESMNSQKIGIGGPQELQNWQEIGRISEDIETEEDSDANLHIEIIGVDFKNDSSGEDFGTIATKTRLINDERTSHTFFIQIFASEEPELKQSYSLVSETAVEPVEDGVVNSTDPEITFDQLKYHDNTSNWINSAGSYLKKTWTVFELKEDKVYQLAEETTDRDNRVMGIDMDSDKNIDYGVQDYQAGAPLSDIMKEIHNIGIPGKGTSVFLTDITDDGITDFLYNSYSGNYLASNSEQNKCELTLLELNGLISDISVTPIGVSYDREEVDFQARTGPHMLVYSLSFDDLLQATQETNYIRDDMFQWSRYFNLEDLEFHSSPLKEGNVYLYQVMGDILKALDQESGETIWEFQADLQTEETHPLLRPVLVDDYLFTAIQDTYYDQQGLVPQLYKLDKETGEIELSIELDNFAEHIYNDGQRIYLVDEDEQILGYDHDLNKQWHKDLENLDRLSPLHIKPDGDKVAVMTRNGVVMLDGKTGEVSQDDTNGGTKQNINHVSEYEGDLYASTKEEIITLDWSESNKSKQILENPLKDEEIMGFSILDDELLVISRNHILLYDLEEQEFNWKKEFTSPLLQSRRISHTIEGDSVFISTRDYILEIDIDTGLVKSKQPILRGGSPLAGPRVEYTEKLSYFNISSRNRGFLETFKLDIE